MPKKLKNVLYIGYYNEKNPRSVKIINLLKQKSVNVIEFPFKVNEKKYIIKKFLKNFKKLTRLDIDAIIYFCDFFSILIFFVKLLSAIKRIPLISKFDISGLYHKLDRNNNKINSYQFLKSFLLDKIQFILPNFIYFLTNAQISHFHKRFNFSRKKCKRLFMGADESLFYPRKNKKKSLFPIVVGYWGTYIPFHGVQHIIEAAKLLKEDKNIKFVMIGKGQKYAQAVKLKETYNLENIEILGYLPLEEFFNQICKINISLGIYGNLPKATWCVTNKVYEAIAMGLPVITRISPANLELFTHRKNVFLCKPANPKSLARAISKLAYDKKLREKIGKNSVKLFKKKCSDQILAEELINSLKDVINT